MSSRKQPRTAPFLIKLQTICSTLPEEIGRWNGNRFEVSEPDRFFEFTQKYFRGNSKTFFRQLSYFRFSRAELLPQGFSFVNKDFKPHDFISLAAIKRTTSGEYADLDISEEEKYIQLIERLNDLTKKVQDLNNTVNQLKRQLSKKDESMLPHQTKKVKTQSTLTSTPPMPSSSFAKLPKTKECGKFAPPSSSSSSSLVVCTISPKKPLSLTYSLDAQESNLYILPIEKDLKKTDSTESSILFDHDLYQALSNLQDGNTTLSHEGSFLL